MTPIIHVHVNVSFPLERSLHEIGIDIQKRIIEAFRYYLELEIDKVKVFFEK